MQLSGGLQQSEEAEGEAPGDEDPDVLRVSVDQTRSQILQNEKEKKSYTSCLLTSDAIVAVIVAVQKGLHSTSEWQWCSAGGACLVRELHLAELVGCLACWCLMSEGGATHSKFECVFDPRAWRVSRAWPGGCCLRQFGTCLLSMKILRSTDQ